MTFFKLIFALFLQCLYFQTILGRIYLPGVTPNSFEQGESVNIYVTKLTSTKTQTPYDYYSLPYCKPSKAKLQSENFGELLSGDRIEDSVYKVEAKVAKSCEVACAKKLKKSDKDKFVRAIEDDYRVHWMLDNLPVGLYSKPTEKNSQSQSSSLFSRGFPVGFTTGSGKFLKHFLYNHLRIVVQYNDPPALSPTGGASSLSELSVEEESLTRIVGFRVEPMSIHHSFETPEFTPGSTVLNTCNSMNPPVNDPKNYQSIDKPDTVIFTYDVVWERSDTPWANRWDVYLGASSPSDQVHWFSITNSLMIVLLLSSMIAMILLRNLRKDIAKYNNPASIEEANEESGWKLVHGDVFRPPTTLPLLFSAFVGTGVQLFCMTFATLSFTLLGLLSPANRGSLTTALILLFVFMGSFAGYFSSMTYKMFRGTEWKTNTLLCAFLFPGLVFVVFFVLNLALWSEGSSGALPFGTFFTLLFLWFCVSVPLVFLGSFFGYKAEIISFPVRTNTIPRAIPAQPWYMNPVVLCLLGGVLPFGAVSVELYFILSALWLHQIYYIFGFLFLVMIVLVVTCAETSILLCYLQLCNEDYRWWWRSFLSAGSCAFYTLLYSVWYNLTELDMHGFVPMLLYFGYMGIISLAFFLIAGTIGYFSCFRFNYIIYSSIKVD